MTALRPLDRLTFVPPPQPAREIGPMGELKLIPLEQLYIDPAYQREILETGKANIRRMVENFSWLLFGTLAVGKRGPKSYTVIDGRHRATAAKAHGGIDAVPCMVHEGGQAKEALAFAALNTALTRIHPLQRFRALVAARDAAAVNVVKVCASAGVTIAPYPKMPLEPGETMALGVIERALKKRDPKVLLANGQKQNAGEDALVAALTLLRAADPDAGLPTVAIQGTLAAIVENPARVGDAERFGRELARRDGAVALIGKAQSRRAARGGALWVNYAQLLGARWTATRPSASAPLQRLMAGR